MIKERNKILSKIAKYFARKRRVNTIAKELTDRPRLIINRSNKFIYAQIIDRNGHVVATSNDMKIKEWTKSERAKLVWIELAKKSLDKKVGEVVFDRNWFLYIWRVKMLADGAREAWLKF